MEQALADAGGADHPGRELLPVEVTGLGGFGDVAAHESNRDMQRVEVADLPQVAPQPSPILRHQRA